jgi:hypothetical protein
MKANSNARILHAERCREGVIVTFADGRTALYSSNLLYSIISNAQEVLDVEEEEEEQQA